MLVMACGVVCLWGRSQIYEDTVVLGFRNDCQLEMVSTIRQLELKYQWIVDGKAFGPEAESYWTTTSPYSTHQRDPPPVGFTFSDGMTASGRDQGIRSFHLAIPHFASTLALSFLSAYLILCKPRKRP